MNTADRPSLTAPAQEQSWANAGQTWNQPSILAPHSVSMTTLGNQGVEMPEGDDRLVMMREIRVVDVDPYDRNPRRTPNPKHDDLKLSIRVQNLLDVPTLTRRPGSARWTLAAGGNTRLQIVQELWAETADPRFEKYTFRITPWRGDGAALLSHITENDKHADLCFWDKAYAFQDLQEQIALERGVASLSLREFEAALLDEGFRINRTTLSNYRFLIRRLRPLSACASRVSGKAVGSLIQPRLNGLSRLLAKSDLDEEGAYARVLSPAMHGYVAALADPQEFDAERLCQDLVVATAAALGRPTGELQRMLALLADAPDLNMDDLTCALAPRPAPANASAARSGSTDTQNITARHREDAPPHDAAPEPAPAPDPQPDPTPQPAWTSSADSAQPVFAANAAPVDEAQRIVANLAHEWARCYGADQLFQRNPDMPAGFYVEFPGEQAPIEDYDAAMAFWWLVQFSRQMYLDRCEAIADPSEWKRTIHESRPGNRPGEWMDIAVARCVFMPEIDTLIRWSFSPHNREIDLFVALMQACHALYALDPDRLLPANERDDLTAATGMRSGTGSPRTTTNP